jgi:translation initiation factor IF-3
LSRPFPSPRNSSPASFIRVNGKIRAREVRVIGVDGAQVGVISLTDAIILARQHGVDLVEVSANAVPPVCRLVDFGKYRYEIAKKEKESKKHQHASTVKEVQLSPRIDPHDLGIKVAHAIDFLCEDMKVKVALKFRGREMAHTEVGFEVINKFIELIAPFGHPDFAPKLVGRAINLMISPLPRNKRAKNPRVVETESAKPTQVPVAKPNHHENSQAPKATPAPPKTRVPVVGQPQSSGLNNPFATIELA